jgi:hypothetical protein
MKALAIGLMMWMQANCNVPGVHPAHNLCDLNWDNPAPVITILPQKELARQFRINNGSIPGGDNSRIKGFFVKGTNIIYMKDQDYSKVLYQSDIIHELVHYIQGENSKLDDCDTHYEIPAYLAQIYYYKKKTGRRAISEAIDQYKGRSCNTLY